MQAKNRDRKFTITQTQKHTNTQTHKHANTQTRKHANTQTCTEHRGGLCIHNTELEGARQRRKPGSGCGLDTPPPPRTSQRAYVELHRHGQLLVHDTQARAWLRVPKLVLPQATTCGRGPMVHDGVHVRPRLHLALIGGGGTTREREGMAIWSSRKTVGVVYCC